MNSPARPPEGRVRSLGEPTIRTRIDGWFASRGWRPFPFQRSAWRAIVAGHDGLLHATTGAGKTYAIWFGALAAFADTKARAATIASAGGRDGKPTRTAAPPPSRRTPAQALTVLWLTPMRALAADTARALAAPLTELGVDWTVGLRTGDTDDATRAAQARRLPTTLVTTPESLSLLLARADAEATLASVALVVVDEWHELLGSKRGVQVQLALARLRRWCPGLRVWGLSATLGDLDEALAALRPAGAGATGAVRIDGAIRKTVVVDTLLPPTVERFPWAGHLGLRMVPAVVQALSRAGSTLVFTNTRSQAELWYQALLDARPDWAGVIALHHGSLDRAVRDWVELGLKEGRLRAVVCTSSLDLGVDFLPVEQVLQVGSAKGVARLLQRAGRSGHAPGRPARVTLVPTHSLELLEAAAARAAVLAGRVEARSSPRKPLDVLVQHLVTVALGGGFVADDLRDEIRATHAYRTLADDEWQWCLDFVSRGGPSLNAYPDYRRAVPDGDGVWQVPDARLARRHRMNIGTIVADAHVTVRWWSRAGGGGALGNVEEGFIARLAPGQCFLFAGRLLELVRVHEMTAYVRRAERGKPAVPRWNGGRMPLSNALADAVLEQLERAEQGTATGPEMERLAPLLALQQRWSALPRRGVLLWETLKSRDGWHAFVYPFAGRQVHLGLGALLAWRASRHAPATFSIAVNDYGLELLSGSEVDWDGLLDDVSTRDALLSGDHLLDDMLSSLNAGELMQRRFREIARVSGLVFQGRPGERRSARQLQASSSLFFEVFRRHDPHNRLLDQARSEVLAQELEIDRLADALARLRTARLVRQRLVRPSPFAFPLMIERLRERLSTESLQDRIARMVAELERAATR